MRWMVPLAANVVLAMLSAAALADDKRDCFDNKDHDLRIKGCSAIIQRDPKDAFAYHSRGVSYQSKGDLDRAITDYGKTIELNPNYAPAYDNRARAYASRGDYTHAVADATKASELAPSNTPRPKTSVPAPRETNAVARTKSESKEAPGISQGPVGTWPPWASYGK